MCADIPSDDSHPQRAMTLKRYNVIESAYSTDMNRRRDSDSNHGAHND